MDLESKHSECHSLHFSRSSYNDNQNFGESFPKITVRKAHRTYFKEPTKTVCSPNKHFLTPRSPDNSLLTCSDDMI